MIMLNDYILESYEIVIFVPEMNEYIGFSEGSGDSLTDEDVAEGLVDYIDYTKYDADGNEIDGGEYLLGAFVANILLEDLIDELLDWEYGSNLPYQIIKNDWEAQNGTKTVP